jgi:hypothetical protein
VRGRLPSTPANVDLPTSNRSFLDEIRIPGSSRRKIPTTRCGRTDAVVSGSPHARFSAPKEKAEAARQRSLRMRSLLSDSGTLNRPSGDTSNKSERKSLTNSGRRSPNR